MWQTEENGDMTINIGGLKLTIHDGHFVHYLIARGGYPAVLLRSGSEDSLARAMVSARREMRRVVESTIADPRRRAYMALRIQRLRDAPAEPRR